MAGTIPTSREAAQPLVDALKAELQVDEMALHVERRNKVDDVAVWYEVSILTHEEIVRLLAVAARTHAKVSVLPDDRSVMKVELRVSMRGSGP